VIDAEVARLTEAGGSVLHEMEERGEFWVVMQDPEGNEFCVQ
jgi:predicted enzyme related to lactoylglutathione lyase